MSKHICNVYCRDGLHCDLVYTDANAQPNSRLPRSMVGISGYGSTIATLPVRPRQ